MELDERTFKELIHRHRDMIWSICKSYRLSAAWTTEDAFHEVLCDIWRGLGSFDKRSSERTWVYRVATNTMITLTRKIGNQPTMEATDYPEPSYRDDDYSEGQEQYVFPVKTSWKAEQQLTVSDTLMPVEWGLDFWEYGWVGQINYCANGTCCGSSLFWQYDSTTHAGSIRINGTQHPFTYDPTTDLITLDYSTHIYGTTVSIGGTLLFRREDDIKKSFEFVNS